MKTTLDIITVNTLEEFLNALDQGYYINNIEYSFDAKELLNYFEKNKNNSPDNMYIYSNMLSFGIGTEIDYKNAMVYAKKAAGYGNPFAMNSVGCMYSAGNGVEKDDNIAFAYFKNAANG